MHPTAKAHRPCLVLRSHEGGYDLYVNFGADYDEEVHMGDFSTLPIAVDAFRTVENTVDTLLDLLARKGALITPSKVEPVFQPGESYLGEGHQMNAAEAAEAGVMGLAAVSGMPFDPEEAAAREAFRARDAEEVAQMRAQELIPGVPETDPAIHAAIRQAQEALDAAAEREAAQDADFGKARINPLTP